MGPAPVARLSKGVWPPLRGTDGTASSTTEVTVNGAARELPPGAGKLLNFLRQDLSLFGAKPGCGEGECGACTVLIDGEPTLSCQVDLADAAGRHVTTIEGLDTAVRLKVEQSLDRVGAAQCSYCSPAMVVRATAVLSQDRRTEDDLRQAMAPNLCRCGCYKRILKAIAETDDPDAAPEPASRPGQFPSWSSSRPLDLTPLEDRPWFDLLGDGIVATSSPELESAANGTGAWLHLAPDGVVTAFVGKVDVGQDNTTAFRLLVSEELAVDLSEVRVVLGDTDLCPYDMGTFGSRSMPDAGETLRQVTAGLRRHLVSLASERLALPPRALKPSGGALRSDNVAIHYGELAGGRRHVEVVGPGQELLGPPKGAPRTTPSSRSDAFSGRRVFVSDMREPGMLFGAVVHPPMPGDRLVALDRGALDQFEGVSLVEEDGFCGVLAPDWASARQAITALSPGFEAAGESFEDLWGHLRSHQSAGLGWEKGFEDERGDVDSAFSSSGRRVEATYATAYIAHMPLETRAALARFDSGRLTVFVGTQTPFRVRSQLAGELGMDETAVRVIVPPTGGAFGGKHGLDVALEAARLARAAGRAVLVHWTRSDEMTAGYLRPAALIDVSLSADEVGRLSAFALRDINAGSAGMSLPYRVANRRLTFSPADAPLRQGSYRALAATANHFARESALDELAALLGEDPADFRLRLLDDERLAEVLEVALAAFGWNGPRSGAAGTGFGVAVGLEKQGRVATCAEVESGGESGFRVVRLLTAYDCGRVVNWDTVVNQVEGATVMALGGALFEEMRFEEGRLVTTRLSDYRVPRFTDLPEISVELVDRPDQASAGAGETPMVAVAPAVANALFQATGRRIRRLPLVSSFKEELS